MPLTLTPADRAYLRWSYCCVAVLCHGFKYALDTKASHPDARETSEYFQGKIPARGFVSADGEVTD